MSTLENEIKRVKQERSFPKGKNREAGKGKQPRSEQGDTQPAPVVKVISKFWWDTSEICVQASAHEFTAGFSIQEGGYTHLRLEELQIVCDEGIAPIDLAWLGDPADNAVVKRTLGDPWIVSSERERRPIPGLVAAPGDFAQLDSGVLITPMFTHGIAQLALRAFSELREKHRAQRAWLEELSASIELTLDEINPWPVFRSVVKTSERELSTTYFVDVNYVGSAASASEVNDLAVALTGVHPLERQRIMAAIDAGRCTISSRDSVASICIQETPPEDTSVPVVESVMASDERQQIMAAIVMAAVDAGYCTSSSRDSVASICTQETPPEDTSIPVVESVMASDAPGAKESAPRKRSPRAKKA